MLSCPKSLQFIRIHQPRDILIMHLDLDLNKLYLSRLVSFYRPVRHWPEHRIPLLANLFYAFPAVGVSFQVIINWRNTSCIPYWKARVSKIYGQYVSIQNQNQKMLFKCYYNKISFSHKFCIVRIDQFRLLVQQTLKLYRYDGPLDDLDLIRKNACLAIRTLRGKITY